MDPLILKYTILSVTFGSAFIAIGYEIQAQARGWPVGEWLSGDASLMKLLAFISMLGSLGITFWVFRWWSPFVVLGLGLVFGFIATQILRSWVQALAIFGTVIGWGFCLVYVL